LPADAASVVVVVVASVVTFEGRRGDLGFSTLSDRICWKCLKQHLILFKYE
jgi:hypothetical protein